MSLIALLDQLEAGNRFFPGLAAEPALLHTALGLLQLAWPLTAAQLTDCHQGLSTQLRRIGVELPPLMPELAPFAREPDPPPRRARSNYRRPQPGRYNPRLDAYREHPEWPLPEALIDADAEDRLIALCDARTAVEG